MTTNIKTTRRTIIAGLAAAPVAGLAAEQEADPILAAIERHREAYRALEDAANLTDEVRAENEGRKVTGDDEALYSSRALAEDEARYDLAHTLPTTRAGASAALDHLLEHGERDDLERFLRTIINSKILAT